MPGLQSLLEKFVTTTHGYTTDSETVFSHPLTDARIALATDDETIRALAVYGWIVAEPSLEPSFNVLPALQRTFPELLSQHPDELDRLLAPDSVAKLIEAQQVEHRGRMARWLLGRSRSTGNTELAKWTREACADIAIQSSHPLAPRLDRPTYIQGPESLGRITGSELTGYQLLLVASSNGRTMLSSAPTMDELFAPNVEWTAAQWIAYEQLLRAIPCSEQTFATQVNALRADAACHSQHLWAIQQGTAAYLGTATDDLRRRFRHSPSSQWLDSASAETGISLRSAGGMNRLIDLYMVEHLTDSEVLEHIVPAMRDADSDFAELSDTALAAIWRSAYNPILNSVLRASADEAVRLRVGVTPPAIKSSPEAMRGLLSSYYGEAPIATLELAGKLHLVSTVDDLPPSLQDEVYLIGGRDRVSGITFEGAVYLIGANTAPEDVCSVFLHEVGEHAALRSMLGRDYGRIVQRFNHLLSEGDTYAVQASMQVPNSTAPSNLDSEHLAHLIQLAAADIEAKEGGEGGFDLGQRCIRDLRTWLYRTPLMRELERQGELEDFKLDAHDIATLAREAVDFHVADIQHSTTALNQWDSKLDSDFISVLHKQTVSERVNALQHLPLEQQIAYVYALGTMQATDGAETLVRMAGAVAEASNSADEVTRLLASEVSALTLRLSTQSRASRHLDTQGLFAAISGTDTPSASVLTLIRSAPNGKWVAEHYQNGLGLTLLEDFDTKEAAVQILGQHHFPVQSKELDSVIARWGSAIAAEHRQLDSQAFKRWFAGSVTRYSDGTPMVLYHGTAKNFSKANGIFWASAPTPAEQRPAPAQAPIVELQKVETPFDQWFGASKIVDEGGKPLTLYHGTSASFNAFKVSLYGAIGAGVYTTPNAGDAQIYGDRLVDLHANLVNPLIGTFAEVRAMQYANETSEKFTERLIGLGYDGVATTDATGRFDYVVAFQPEQLKSASQNNGMYDRSNPDIRFRDMPQHGSPTETVAFKNWFDGSSITDQQGQPLVVYHGTDADFTSFKAGPNYFTTRTDYSYIRNCDVVMPVYLNIKNPYRPESQHEIESIRSNPERYEELKGLGYDGMLWSAPGNMMKGASGWGNDLPQIVTFYPNQIKSAIGNVGSFDRASNDIRFKQKHAVQTSTPEFQQWFGESKLVAPSGEPMVVYHGTNMDFSVFNTNSVQSRFPYSFGFHFTDQRNEASTYADSITNAAAGFNPASPYVKPSMEGGNVMPVFIRAENPLIIKTDQLSASIEADINRAEIVTQLEEAQAAGQPYDSVIIKRERGDEYDGLNVIVFNPNQIKSAIGNAGSFDRASNDIRFGLTALTQPPIQPGPRPVTALDASFSPLSDGTTTDTNRADSHVGLDTVLRGSTLADEYAELRQNMASYSQPALEADRALVMPVYLNVKTPFDGDKLSTSSLKVGELRDELVRQTEASGRHIDVMLVASLVKTITKAARVEESGPYYRRHDFWMNRTSHFGGAGAAALQQLFTHCGFDSIKLTENDHLTFGVFSAAQVKSASGNTGLYSANPDIRFAFAGTNAATSDLSRLKQAKLLAEQEVSAGDIWKSTGWMFGADGDWRFEIDDSKARIRGYDHEKDEAEVTTTEPDRFVDWVEESIHRRSGVPLSQFYDHPELYAAYPQLANLNVVAVERMPGDETLGSFGFHRSFAQSTLYVAAPYTLRSDGPTFEEVLAHEIQHCIQHIEGFAPGAMVSDFESDQTTSDELKSSMLAYIEIHDHSKSLGCSPEKFAELSGYSQQIIERVGTWRQQGNWDSNVTSFRRSVMSPFELYFHEAGEVEARNTQHRIDMSAEQRAVTFPLDTIDVESSLIKVSRKFRVFANSTMAPEATAYGRADSAFEWAIKTQGWRTGLNDNAQLLHAGNAMNLFAVKTDAASRAYHGEIFAVALDDSVIGSFLYGPAPEGAGQHLNAAAMVHPDFRRQGIASAAYNAIEGLTGKKLAPSLANTSSSAKAFWEARQAPATKNATVGDSNALSQWMRQSSTVGADGKPTVFYHGTMAAFENFDAARHRSILNNGYQGDAFHFSPSPDVASLYSTAARNQLFRQFDLYQAAEKALPPTITQLLKGLVEEGQATWAKYSEDEFCNMRDMCLSKGFDINDLMDLSEYVEGSAGIHPRENINLFAEHHDCDMPDDIKDLAVTLGLADAVPVPIVMPVYLRCENTLYTDDKQQARDAQSNGYDSVCYSGDGTVGQDPEWMVFHTANIRSVFEFEQDAKVLMQEHSNPFSPVPGASITPPASTLFDHWFEGSSCINQFGEPRLVFVRDNPGNAFNTFADLNAASPDAQGKVTPAILAIRSPFIVTDSAHIAITDLNDKLGRRKTGLIVGDLLRDGQLGIEDIIKNPRCNKWIQQAGYDGAIYRNRDGENRYVTFDDAQAVVGSAVQITLNESSQWGPVPAAPAMSFVGDRARARQFTLSNHGKPHGHVVPMSAADQYLANSDRLYINHLGNIRLSATNIATMCEAPDTPKHLGEFLTRNRKGLAGKARIEDIFAEHIRSLRQGINQARMDARADTPQASYQRNMVDKLSNALVWAIEHSSSGKSFKGLVSEDLLQWNKPLSQQSPMVLQVLSTLGINGLYQVVGSGTLQLKTCNRYTADEFSRDYPDGRVEQIDAAGLTGRACFEELANDLGGSKQAADLLSSMGITGAQQSTAEVLLFKPSFTHAPLLPLALCKPTPGALNGDSLAIQDLGGVMIKGGVHTACKSLWGNQERALEVVESAIHLLSTRHSQLADFSSPLAVNDQHNKQQLAEAKALQQELMFTAIPSQFLPWADPLSEQHLKTLSPVIKIDPAHALPGSAVFRLIAGRQEGIEGAKAMLSKVGIVGVCTEDATLAWSTGARTVCKTVAADTPIAGYAFADLPAKSSLPNLSMM